MRDVERCQVRSCPADCLHAGVRDIIASLKPEKTETVGARPGPGLDPSVGDRFAAAQLQALDPPCDCFCAGRQVSVAAAGREPQLSQGCQLAELGVQPPAGRGSAGPRDLGASFVREAVSFERHALQARRADAASAADKSSKTRKATSLSNTACHEESGRASF
eukprot:scaffold421279_cov34-Prasinocladus_malaysianus.AAC.1